MISGPKSYRDYRETGPRTGIKVNDFVAWDQAQQWGKRQKQAHMGKISASETGLAVLFPLQTTSSPQCEAWSQVTSFGQGMAKSVTPEHVLKNLV